MSYTEGREAVPQIAQHPYFQDQPPYRVLIDPRMCGRVFKLAGMDDDLIRETTVAISPETKPMQHGIHYSDYDHREKVLFLFPSNLWKLMSQTLSMAELVIKGETTIPVLNATELLIVQGSYHQTIDRQGRQKLGKLLARSAAPFINHDSMGDFLKTIREDQDLARAQAMLTAGVQRQLTWALARQAKLSLEKPPTRIDRAAQYAAIKGVPVLASFLGVWYMLSGSITEGRLVPLEALAVTGVSLYFYERFKEISPALTQRFNPREIKARRFGQKIQNDPNFQELINLQIEHNPGFEHSP